MFIKARRLLINLLFICLTPLPLLGQQAVKLLTKADEAFKKEAYAQAIELYEAALPRIKSTDASINPLQARLNLANAYFSIKDFERAEKYYREVIPNLPSVKGENLKAVLRFAQTLASNGKYNESKQVYEKYALWQEQDARGVEFGKLYSNTEALLRNASSYRIDYLGINSSDADFSPAFYKNGFVFVSSRGKSTVAKRIFGWDNSSPTNDLFMLPNLASLQPSSSAAAIGTSEAASRSSATSSQPLGSGFYQPTMPNDSRKVTGTSVYGSEWNEYKEKPSIPTKWFSRTLNSKYNEGPAAFFHTQDRVIFTRNSPPSVVSATKKTVENAKQLNLFFADKNGDDWQNITSFPYNNTAYSCGHPTISADDKRIYFASDMPGGFGGTDIYMCELKDGIWSKPINLGGQVNTQGNELYPFLDNKGQLYFASDGHPGLGGLDIFYARISSLTGLPLLLNVRNIGAPLNSSSDDFGLITDADRKTGFFSSNRKRGGIDDDIYMFERNGPLYGCRDLHLVLVDSTTQKPLPQVPFVYTSATDSSFQEMATTNGQGLVKLCLPADNTFTFRINLAGYQLQRVNFSTAEVSDYEPTKLTISLVPHKPAPPPPKPETVVAQRVVKRETPLSTVFRGVILAADSGTPLAGVTIHFRNLCSGLVQSVVTKQDGIYEFVRSVDCDYELMAESKGYATSKEIIGKVETHRSLRIFKRKKPVKNIPNYTGSLFDTKLFKVGDVVKLDNIYYDFSTWELSAAALQELDRLVRILKRYPNMVVEVRSHTDTRGNAAQNLQLSQKRVDEVIRYLVKQGIERRRLKGIGMGETAPINQCGDGVQCTETEHQRNRRTEFKILQIEKIF